MLASKLPNNNIVGAPQASRCKPAHSQPQQAAAPGGPRAAAHAGRRRAGGQEPGGGGVADVLGLNTVLRVAEQQLRRGAVHWGGRGWVGSSSFAARPRHRAAVCGRVGQCRVHATRHWPTAPGPTAPAPTWRGPSPASLARRASLAGMSDLRLNQVTPTRSSSSSRYTCHGGGSKRGGCVAPAGRRQVAGDSAQARRRVCGSSRGPHAYTHALSAAAHLVH